MSFRGIWSVIVEWFGLFSEKSSCQSVLRITETLNWLILAAVTLLIVFVIYIIIRRKKH